MWLVVYGYMFCAACALALLLTPIAVRVAERRGIVDLPGERKLQRGAVPLLGGAAICTSVVAILLANCAIAALAARSPVAIRLIPQTIAAHLGGALSVFPQLMVILLGGVMMFLLGLWDDLSDLPPRVKLLGQILVALSLISLDVRVTVFVPSYLFSAAVTVAWVVVITNAFNLLDNMDGLCAGVALIATAVFWSISACRGNYFIAVMLAVFGGSLLGFLRYNAHPATIFMGDAGSMFIGYFLAVLTIMQTYYNPASGGPLAVLMPLVILAVPLYDTLSVIVIRTFRGESIFKADRRHFSHRLVALGMSQRGAVCFIYLVTLCTGLSATLLPRVGWGGGVIVLAQTILIVSVIAVLEYFGGNRRGDAGER
jgi:UDP-GlcNAc:undecaprenyl-phosphate GlcNAc-1-phosphate transferase